MKHFYRLLPHLPQPVTPHAKACMEKIRAILSRAPAEKQVERIPGEDREEDNA